MLARILHRVHDLADAALRALRRRLGHALRPPRRARSSWARQPDLVRSRPELVAENAPLRQLLTVLARSTERPRVTGSDRALLVLLLWAGASPGEQATALGRPGRSATTWPEPRGWSPLDASPLPPPVPSGHAWAVGRRRGTGVLIGATGLAVGGLAVLAVGYLLARDWLMINPAAGGLEVGPRPQLVRALARALGFPADEDVLELLAAAIGGCALVFALGVWTGWAARGR
jgi:hypothetical protein